MEIRTWGVVVVLLAAVAGCGKLKGGGGDASSASADAGADPVTDLAKAALACKVDESGYFDSDCPQHKAWNDTNLMSDGKADATLVTLLENADEKLRRLAVEALRSHGKSAFTDKALAGRIVGQGEKETSTKVGSIGSLIGRIKMKDTGWFDRVKALAANGSKDISMRKDIVNSVIGTNYDNDDVWAWQKERIKDSDGDIRKSAIKAFWGNPYNMRPEQTCALLKDNFTHSDIAIAAIALAYSSGNEKCYADFDTVLNDVEKLLKSPVPDDAVYDLFNPLRDPWKNTKVNDKQKARKIAIATAAALNAKSSTSVRRAALSAVKDRDPAAAKTLAGKLLKDKDSSVASLAKSISEGK